MSAFPRMGSIKVLDTSLFLMPEEREFEIPVLRPRSSFDSVSITSSRYHRYVLFLKTRYDVHGQAQRGGGTMDGSRFITIVHIRRQIVRETIKLYSEQGPNRAKTAWNKWGRESGAKTCTYAVK